MFTRRHLIASGAALTTAAAMPASAQSNTRPNPKPGAANGAFTLPELPYAVDALASAGMSQETLEYHHGKHHNAYVEKLNELVVGTEWEGKPLEEIVKGSYEKGALAQSGLFNNSSQHWNHSQFWEMMTPEPGAIPSELETALKENFGSLVDFKKKFAEAGGSQFGSGWAWLVKNSDGSLEVTKTENGVNPLCFDQTALLGCDVWEHSYYIDFRNGRSDYLSNFLEKLVNWENVASRM